MSDLPHFINFYLALWHQIASLRVCLRRTLRGFINFINLISSLAAGTKGRSEQNFITNTSPQNGTCSIYPTEGEALKTFFQIKCPDWQDEDGYMTYKVFKRTKLLQHWNGPVLNSTLLPPGKLEENYTYSITVTISDKYGSFSQVFITVKASIVISLRKPFAKTIVDWKGGSGGRWLVASFKLCKLWILAFNRGA